MRTSWPWTTSSWTPAGVIATRYSWFLTSFGTPILIGPPAHLGVPVRPGRVASCRYCVTEAPEPNTLRAYAAMLPVLRRGTIKERPAVNDVRPPSRQDAGAPAPRPTRTREVE